MSVPDSVRHKSRMVIFEEYLDVGYNYRMTDIQAAIGREQLKRLPEIIARRRDLAGRYFELLQNIPGIVLPTEPEWARSNWQSFCVRLPDGCDQRATMQRMLDSNIATRRGIMCVHLEPAYESQSYAQGQLSESETAQNRTVVLPLYHQLTYSDQDYIVKELEETIKK